MKADFEFEWVKKKWVTKKNKHMQNSTYITTYILDSGAKSNNFWATENFIYIKSFFFKLNKITKNHEQLLKFWKLDYLTNESKQNSGNFDRCLDKTVFNI